MSYFLNAAMLAGLVVVAIPIIIHLLNRQRATLVDWGAMRFLLESLTLRRRRIMLEEIILMALRCLVLALLVLAMARPFLVSRASIPWAPVLPSLLVAAILVGVAGAVWSSRRARWALLAAAAVLALFALTVSGLEAALQKRAWSLGGGERDVAIVIDGSASMTVPVEGKTNFDRAVEEARAVVAACRPADAVCLILAGPVPRPVVPNPVTDRDLLLQALHDLRPSGGSMRVIEALSTAATCLAEGHNPAKKIVLLTDGQAIGWHGRSEARWKFLAAGLASLPAPPQVVCRTFPLPRTLRNLAVGDVRLSRRLVGTDRPVGIEVTVLNTGTTAVEPVGVELVVDGATVGRGDTGEMDPQAAETVHFEHRFLEPGLHRVAARLLADDELPADNQAQRVLPIVDRLPVLVVEGRPSTRPLGGAASFLEIALAPVEPGEEEARAGPPPSEGNGRKGADRSPPALGNLCEVRVVPAPDIETVQDFSPFGLVVLADVPRLPEAVARRLARHVSEGAGLLVVPGENVVPAFYEKWTTEGGQRLLPARLDGRRSLPESPAHIGLRTLSHPALALLADAPRSDADRALLNTYWRLVVDENDPAVRVGGRLDTGDPLLVERHVGKGHVLLTAMSLDRRDGNLPALKCFVPLVHELAYYLAAPTVLQPNVRPGSELVLDLPARTPKALAEAETYADLSVEVLGPGGERFLADLAPSKRGLRLAFGQTYAPGLYHVLVPRALAEAFEVPLPPAPQDRANAQPPRSKPSAEAEAGRVPFVVLDDPDEGRLIALTEGDLAAPTKLVGLFRTDSTDRLIEAVTGDVPGEELWEYLILAMLVGLLVEVGLARWIATQRRMHALETVSFGPETVDAETFRARARQLLATDGGADGRPGAQPQGSRDG